jgi:transcriptional regulator of arginine metabolism
MTGRPRRHAAIRQLLSDAHVRNQADLAQRLRRLGHRATQATLSRDLRLLGVVKGPDGYALPDALPGPDSPRQAAPLHAAVRALLLSATPAASVLVLRTPPGSASALALEIDRAPPPGVIGTVAGDDTVFVATAGPAPCRRLAASLTALTRTPPARTLA